MTDYTITLSQTDLAAMDTITEDVKAWIQHAASNRARLAKIAIIEKLSDYCAANNVDMADGEDAQVAQAYELGVVDTLANTNPQAPTGE